MRASSGAWRARHRWRSTPARGQVPPTLRARCPAVPTASYHRLSVSTATVSVSMVAGRILAAWRSWRATVDEDGHYSFAVPLGCRSPPRAPIGRFATPCDLALRLVGGRPAGIATWSAYPSIAAAPINPKIDVMGQKPPQAPATKTWTWPLPPARETDVAFYPSLPADVPSFRSLQCAANMPSAGKISLHNHCAVAS